MQWLEAFSFLNIAVVPRFTTVGFWTLIVNVDPLSLLHGASVGVACERGRPPHMNGDLRYIDWMGDGGQSSSLWLEGWDNSSTSLWQPSTLLSITEAMVCGKCIQYFACYIWKEEGWMNPKEIGYGLDWTGFGQDPLSAVVSAVVNLRLPSRWRFWVAGQLSYLLICYFSHWQNVMLFIKACYLVGLTAFFRRVRSWRLK
jgi:hypothetical protein